MSESVKNSPADNDEEVAVSETSSASLTKAEHEDDE